eukprot:3925544-Amphidinium_carterae.1
MSRKEGHGICTKGTTQRALRMIMIQACLHEQALWGAGRPGVAKAVRATCDFNASQSASSQNLGLGKCCPQRTARIVSVM